MSPEVKILMLLFMCYNVFLFALVMFIHSVKTIIRISKNSKQIKQEIDRKQKMIDEMKINKELHEWMTVQQVSVNGEISNYNVCKKTGWCPQLNMFFTDAYVRNEILNQKYQKQYSEYKTKIIREMANDHGKTIEQMEQIVEAVFDIKKQFALNWIDNQKGK